MELVTEPGTEDTGDTDVTLVIESFGEANCCFEEAYLEVCGFSDEGEGGDGDAGEGDGDDNDGDLEGEGDFDEEGDKIRLDLLEELLSSEFFEPNNFLKNPFFLGGNIGGLLVMIGS